MTTIKKCKCESEFQDEIYGKDLRVCNIGEKSKKSTCTVCGTKS